MLADAPTNWQRWVAIDKVKVRNGVLTIMRTELTAHEWAARYVPEH